MSFPQLAGAAWRAMTSACDGPSLYDLCDPVLLHPPGGNPHLAKFYRTALGNPALRPLLRRAGIPELDDPARFETLQMALTRARDDHTPDWAAIGQPVAAVLDTVRLQHPRPGAVSAPAQVPGLGDIENIIRSCE